MAKFTREDLLEYYRLKGKPGKVVIAITKYQYHADCFGRCDGRDGA